MYDLSDASVRISLVVIVGSQPMGNINLTLPQMQDGDGRDKDKPFEIQMFQGATCIYTSNMTPNGDGFYKKLLQDIQRILPLRR